MRSIWFVTVCCTAVLLGCAPQPKVIVSPPQPDTNPAMTDDHYRRQDAARVGEQVRNAKSEMNDKLENQESPMAKRKDRFHVRASTVREAVDKNAITTPASNPHQAELKRRILSDPKTPGLGRSQRELPRQP